MSEWIEHDGKGMPVDADVRVFVKTRDGWTDEDFDEAWRAGSWGGEDETSNWIHFGNHAEIVAYRLADEGEAK